MVMDIALKLDCIEVLIGGNRRPVVMELCLDTTRLIVVLLFLDLSAECREEVFNTSEC
jgi:hypothetical protein